MRCGSGEARTYFGGTVGIALQRALGEHPPATLPWREIYEDVVFAIDAMEVIANQRPSKPGFVQTPGPALTAPRAP